MPLPVGKGAVSVAFVSPSVAHIANNSRTRRPSVLKFRIKVLRHWWYSHTSFKMKGQRSRSPDPLMPTHIVRHIFRKARPTNFKLGIWMEDDNPHQPQAPWPPRSKVKVARSRDQSEPSWPNAVPVSVEPSGGISCRPNPAATLFVSYSFARWQHSWEILCQSCTDQLCLLATLRETVAAVVVKLL